MGDEKITVSGNTVVTNYKPVDGRQAQNTDIKLTNDENKTLEVPKNYTSLFDAVRNLDGKPELSWEDALLANSLIGENNI